MFLYSQYGPVFPVCLSASQYSHHGPVFPAFSSIPSKSQYVSVSPVGLVCHCSMHSVCSNIFPLGHCSLFMPQCFPVCTSWPQHAPVFPVWPLVFPSVSRCWSMSQYAWVCPLHITSMCYQYVSLCPSMSVQVCPNTSPYYLYSQFVLPVCLSVFYVSVCSLCASISQYVPSF